MQEITPSPPLFRDMLHKINFTPEVDMFASPGNCKLAKFVSRWPHHEAVGVDALKMDLTLFDKV